MRAERGFNGDGVDGIDGVDGVDGIDVVDGIDGIDVVDGIDGIDGVDGVDGVDGIDGAAPGGGPGQRHIDARAARSGDVCPPEAGERHGVRGERVARDVRPAAADAARVIAALAGAQEGSVTRSELLAAGLSRHTIDHRAKHGHLHRIHRGVYIAGHMALAPNALERAALLACGANAVISHWSAAYLWMLTKQAPPEVYVTVIDRQLRPKGGMRIHRTSRLAPADIRVRRRIRLTSPARTLIDLARDAGREQLEAMVAEARVLGLLRDGELQNAVGRAGKRPGVAAMKAYLSSELGPVLTRSACERRMLRLVHEAGLPRPVVNARVEGWEVDFYWPKQRVIVEVDGYQFHGHRRAFERDRKKGMALAATGHAVIRVTAGQLLHQSLLVAAQLAMALANAA